jgi:hypothetical protein
VHRHEEREEAAVRVPDEVRRLADRVDEPLDRELVDREVRALAGAIGELSP